MMNYIIKDIVSLSEDGLFVEIGVALPQYWGEIAAWDGYTNTPRPSCGFVYVAEDITMTFVSADGQRVVAHKDDLVYCPEGQKYTVYIEGGKRRQGESYVLNFSLRTVNNKQVHLSDRIGILFRSKTPFAESRIKEICQLKLSAIPRHSKQQSVFLDLIDYIAGEIKNHQKEYYPIRKGIAALNAEWDKNERIEKYATLCRMSESNFYLLFKKAVGMSPVEYRNRIRISHAKEVLIHNTTATVAEIAESVGFPDPFFFSRTFKKYVGESPAAYRKK